MAFPRLGGFLPGRGCNTPRTNGRNHQTVLEERCCDDGLFAGNRLSALDCHGNNRLAFPARPLAADFVCFHWISVGTIADFRSMVGILFEVVDGMDITMFAQHFRLVRSLACVALGFLATNDSLAQQYGSTRSHTNTKRGALIGGVAGAAIGGVVGNQKDRAGKGALIGGAVGAIAGAALGNEKDKQVARQSQIYHYPQHVPGTYYIPSQHGYVHPSQPVYVTPQTYPTTPSNNSVRRPVSVSEVVTMTRNGVSDSIIISHIRSNGVLSRPSTNDIVSMAQRGVSNAVIAAMQGDFIPQIYYQDSGPNSVVYPSSSVTPSGSLLAPPRTLPQVDRRGF